MEGLAAFIPIQGGTTILWMKGVKIVNKNESRAKWSFILFALRALAWAGETLVLQTKRIDVQTMGTPALGSLRCSAEQEEELLAHMSELARKLARFSPSAMFWGNFKGLVRIPGAIG